MIIGIPIIIAAPSGAGKTSLVKALVNEVPNLLVSISYTTRPKRPGENNDVDYHFVSHEYFEKLLTRNALLEYAQVFDYYYGTDANWVYHQLSLGFDILFEIDWQGAQQIRKKIPESISIFILPPSLTTLQNRLSERGQDDPIVINKRMEEAKSELSHYNEFDYLVINEDFQAALIQLKAIIITHRLRLQRQQEQLTPLLANLLA